MSDMIKVPWDGWEVVRKLGKGSYGTVYEIERTVGDFSEKSAMKVIPIPNDNKVIEDAFSDGYDDASIITMCESYLNNTLEEYRTMRSLSGNTNIVSCEDIAYRPLNDSFGWEVFIRMELLTPFLNYYKSTEPDETEILKVGKDICQALLLCEENNIVHRDVKPGNIFVTKKGQYKLGDFGVAKIMDHATNATRVGTERFMAPEVIKRDKYGKDVDLYSLGLVLYWLLNERRMPFLEPGKVPTAQEQQDAYARRLSGENLPAPKNGSQALKDLVLKACAYDREDRFQSAQEMLDALNNVGLVKSKTDTEEESVVSELEEEPVIIPIVPPAQIIDEPVLLTADPEATIPPDATIPLKSFETDPLVKKKTDLMSILKGRNRFVFGIAALLAVVLATVIIVVAIVGNNNSNRKSDGSVIGATRSSTNSSQLSKESKTTKTKANVTSTNRTYTSRTTTFKRTTKKTATKTKKTATKTKKTATKTKKTATKTKKTATKTKKTATKTNTTIENTTESTVTETVTHSSPDNDDTSPTVTVSNSLPSDDNDIDG